jgi:cytochrome c
MSVPGRLGARSVVLFAIAAGAFSATAGWAQAAGDAIRGKVLYQAKCGGCHSIDENRIGPLHRGVVGRAVASVPGYEYSDALKKLGGTWTPERLDTWLQGPQAVAPGAKMFNTVDDSDQRRDIIAYLMSLTSAPRRH